jgi:hypothetical protein
MHGEKHNFMGVPLFTFQSKEDAKYAFKERTQDHVNSELGRVDKKETSE